MITNKLIHIIIAITTLIVIPVQLITTFVLGLLVNLTFGLMLIPFSVIWIVLFLGPLLGLSYVYEKVAITRPFISVIGIPLAVIGHIYVALLPSMGQIDSRCAKMVICQTFPYTWRFLQFRNNKLNIGKNDVLAKILREVSSAMPLDTYLDNLRADVISRKDYVSGKYDELGW
jgi:hypothetical protein